MSVQLTTGAIPTMLQGVQVENAVLQVMSHKKVAGDSNRYRLLISDGRHLNSLAMLGSQLSHMIHENQLAPNTIIQINRYTANQVQGGSKKVIIILDLTVLVPGANTKKIGEPVAYAPPVAPPPGTHAAPVPAANSSALPRPAPAPVAAYKPPGGGMAPTAGFNTQNMLPIAHLTPYANKWTICARITGKGDIRTWANARGEGKLFSFELLDESGEIRCTAFKEQCDKFFDLLEVNKVYYLSRATLKPANKQYCGSITHDFELTLNSDSVIEPCVDSGTIPGMQFNFVPISDLQAMDKTGLVDVLGVCKEAGEVDHIMSRKLNKELTKRDLKLVDQSNTEVTFTLWGSQAEKFDGSSNPVMAIKGAKISDFNGCSLGAVGSTKIQLNPDIDAAFKLKGWFDSEGCATESTSISKRAARQDNFRSFQEAKLEGIGAGGESAYYCACATILQVRHENCLYQSCPNGDCKKKVLDQQNGMFRCEKCNQEFPEFRWRLLMSMNVADMTGNQWMTAFQEQAEAVLGVSAEELGRMRDAGEDENFQLIFRRANFKQYNFTLRAKMETYNEESRLRVVVTAVTPVQANLETHRKRLETEIAAMRGSLADL